MVSAYVGGEVLDRRAQRTFAQAQLEDGQRLLDLGKLEEASLSLEGLRRAPKDCEARDLGLLLLGGVLEDLGLPQRALLTYQEHERDYPQSERASAVARRLEELGGEELSPWQRFRALKETESATPGERWAQLQEAAALVAAGKLDQAPAVLEGLVRHPSQAAPARAEGLLLLALCHDGLGQVSLASRLYGRFLREYAESGDLEALDLAQGRALRLHEDRNATLTPEALNDLVGQLATRAPSPSLAAREAAPVEPSSEALLSRPELPTPARTVSAAQLKADLKLLDVGARVGPYVLAEKLGEGGFGEVYRGLLPVAIKLARSPEDVERLRHFADMQARVSSDRIVRPLALDLSAETPYVVMELVEGATLRELLLSGRLEPGAALKVSLEIARALADTHAVGLAHLDLKPENVLISREGEVKLTDFDLARSAESPEGLNLSLSFTQAGPAGGTLAYMSPEQRAGKPADARSDVYTFGVCLFEALTGTLPQPGDRPSQYVEGLPPQVDALFERCFARQERRYANAQDLMTDLERALASYEGPRVSLAELGARLPRPEALVDPTPVTPSVEAAQGAPSTEGEPALAEEEASAEDLVPESTGEEEVFAEDLVAEESAADEVRADQEPAEEPAEDEEAAEDVQPAEAEEPAEAVEPPEDVGPAEGVEPAEGEGPAKELAEDEEPPGARPSLDDLIAARATRARAGEAPDNEPLAE